MYLIKKIATLLFFLLVFCSPLFPQNNGYVILVSFDGFRWDYANRNITPNLDFIEQNGVHALSLKPCFPSKTFPNHYSIVTGMYPENHGIIANNFIDPFTNEIYKISDTAAVRNPKWYKGEAIWETAKRQGLKTASYFWPGSELNLEYRRPDYVEKYEHKRNYNLRVNGVLDWLQLPYSERPHFITLYFDATDTYGHKFGTNSREVNNSIMQLDSLLGSLFNGLKQINLYDSVNVIVVSDHGMTDISKDRIISVDQLLAEFNCRYSDNGPVMFLYADPNKQEAIYQKLKASQNHFTVYKKNELPAYFHYSNNHFVPELILVADAGWSLITEKDKNWYANNDVGGNHGYDPNFIDMQGIFYAIGPAFKQNYTCGTLNNVDIYPLLAKILRIFPNNNIDGNLINIEFLLKENVK